MDATIIASAEAWTSEHFDEQTRSAAFELIQRGGDELADAFYKDLEFGTGGMRGIMGVGTNRMNKYTIGQATQGLANYLNKEIKGEQIKVAIAYDCRHNSDSFAELVGNVLSANGIEVFVYESLRPTPQLSFTVRELNCHAGIVLTASHNPPEYNGYKVYWGDGAQIVPPHDAAIIENVRQVAVSNILFEGDDDLIHTIGQEMDDKFQNACVTQGFSNEGKDDLTVVFTSLHGTSIKSIPHVLDKAGFKKVHIVEEQAEPNGDFPTVASPNPEEPEALKLAIELAEKTNADILIGTDPDADRIGIGVRDLNNEIILLNGNQTAAVMTWYLIQQWKAQGKLNGKQYIAETIVTTDLLKDIADGEGIPTYFCLTGFKWIANIIHEFDGKEEFIGGGEESFGYMVGDFVRDKDSVSSAMLCCEIAAWANANGKSFYQLLLEIYQEFGFYKERLISIKKGGMSGAEEIANMMSSFRKETPKQVGGTAVVATSDFDSSMRVNTTTGTEEAIDMPKSNVFQIHLADGSKITARPSGTEPKIKFYISVNKPLDQLANAARIESELEKYIDQIVEDLNI